MNREMEFWRPRLVNGGAKRIMKGLDYGHQQLYLPLVDAWGLNLLRTDRIIEFGCGPCGLAPWFQVPLRREGVEPMADDFKHLGINYGDLGFDQVHAETAQQFIMQHYQGEMFDLAICCNALDHDPQPGEMLRAIAKTARALFVCYDLRFVATELHPGLTVGGLDLPAPWKCTRQDEISMARWPEMLKEVKARRCQLWERAA
ncbi:MAG: hypothetical protein WC322_06315 [Candidatus Paceibacterota bacterium]|jgi:hypothetical protein